MDSIYRTNTTSEREITYYVNQIKDMLHKNDFSSIVTLPIVLHRYLSNYSEGDLSLYLDQDELTHLQPYIDSYNAYQLKIGVCK